MSKATSASYQTVATNHITIILSSSSHVNSIKSRLEKCEFHVIIKTVYFNCVINVENDISRGSGSMKGEVRTLGVLLSIQMCAPISDDDKGAYQSSGLSYKESG